jgi:ectoine hydroxylase-related dioxygenase (phytanoyl-CoA dioxygenase family)
MPHPILSREQRDSFWRSGYLLVPEVIDPPLIAALRDDLEAWTAESRNHEEAYGETANGPARFEVAVGHSRSRPRLSRVNSPAEISESYFRCMADSRMTDMTADLIGPNIKCHHSRIDTEEEGGRWRQDFLLTPHSNDDTVSAVLFLDDVTDGDAAIEVAPGSHKGELHTLWHGGDFTAAVDETVAAESHKKAVKCTGPAGSCCFMHGRLLHGSGQSPLRSALFTTVYTAEDAIPLSPNPVPSRFEGLLVRGRKTNLVRSIAFEMELPKKPPGVRVFAQQHETVGPAPTG